MEISEVYDPLDHHTTQELALALRGHLCDDVTPAEQLAAIREVRGWMDTAEVQLVAEMRWRGASWLTIGRLLGVTKQAAQQRFGDIIG